MIRTGGLFMLFNKIFAILSAIAIIGTYSVNNSYLFAVSAENTSVLDSDSNTCSIVVSMSSLSEPIPEDTHIKAKLIKYGEETEVIDEWEITQDGVKELKGLEYSEDFSYKIIIDNQSEDYTLPESTSVILDQKGDTDTIFFYGRSAERAYSEDHGIYDNIRVTATCFFYGYNMEVMNDLGESTIDEKYIIDENGARYCGRGCIELPDGHYTAYVILNNKYRFVQPNSEAAVAIIEPRRPFTTKMTMDYFDRDYSKGFEFDVVNGKTDTLLDFYCEPKPNKENACSADISVIDSETGEPLEGIKLELTNERLINDGYITWNSSDIKQMSFDKLLCLEKDYVVTPLNTSELYYVPKVTFSFSSLGQHKDVVIKAKRKNNENVPKIELPDEDPVPVDEKHCAVIAGVMDNDRKPAKGVTASIYKKVHSEKVKLLQWNAEEEPVKIINDIEYDENAEYYFAINGESDDYYRYSDMKLELSKGGSIDKVVQNIFPTSMKSVKLERTTYDNYNYGAIGRSNQGWGGIRVTDMQGYRYPCIPQDICLPDGEYLLRTNLSSGYRIVQPNTEIECAIINYDPSLKGYFTKNAEIFKSGAKFTVKNGECNDTIRFFAEPSPTYQYSCSADIKVVYEETGEIAEGINVFMYSPYNPGYINWNTTDTPMMNFDNLRYLNTNYSFELTNIPAGYAYIKEEAMFSFEKHGESKELIIKLSKTTKKGDANCDGYINMADAVIIMQTLANPNKYGINGTDNYHVTSQGAENADVDISTSGITGNDALKIQTYLLKLINSLEQSN